MFQRGQCTEGEEQSMSNLCLHRARGEKRYAEGRSDQTKPSESKTKGQGHGALLEVRREIQQRLRNEFKIDARYAKEQIEFGRDARGKKDEIGPKAERVCSIKRDDRHENQTAESKGFMVADGLPGSPKSGPAPKRFRARVPQGSRDAPGQTRQLNPAPSQ